MTSSDHGSNESDTSNDKDDSFDPVLNDGAQGTHFSCEPVSDLTDLDSNE
jgi:hypothetical protein